MIERQEGRRSKEVSVVDFFLVGWLIWVFVLFCFCLTFAYLINILILICIFNFNFIILF